MQAPLEPLAQIVDLLALRPEQRVSARHEATLRLQALTAPLDAAQRAAPGAQTKFGETRKQIGADRHRHLGSGGRRRRAQIGREIAQSRVRLMAHGGDYRNWRFGHGADHRLLVKGPQILDGPATARDDEQIRPRDRAAGRNRAKPTPRRRPLARQRPRPAPAPARRALDWGSGLQGGAGCRE